MKRVKVYTSEAQKISSVGRVNQLLSCLGILYVYCNCCVESKLSVVFPPRQACIQSYNKQPVSCLQPETI